MSLVANIRLEPIVFNVIMWQCFVFTGDFKREDLMYNILELFLYDVAVNASAVASASGNIFTFTHSSKVITKECHTLRCNYKTKTECMVLLF